MICALGAVVGLALMIAAWWHGYWQGQLRELRSRPALAPTPWPDALKPFMEEAQREVDAMFPNTPAIAPKRVAPEEVQQANRLQIAAGQAGLANQQQWKQLPPVGDALLAEMEEIMRPTFPPLPSELYVDPTTMEVVDREGWRTSLQAWEAREPGQPVVFRKPWHSGRTHWWPRA